MNAPPKSPADIFIESVNSANAVAPSDVVENDDKPRNGIKYISKTDDTIGGALSEELENWHTSSFNETFAPHLKRPSIINAPPGYGKTTFVIRELRKKAYEQGYYVLLIVNRSILKGQIARLISEGLSGHTVGDPEGSLSVYGNIVLCTYQYFMKGIDLIKRDFACLPPIEKTDVKDKINYRLIQKIGYIVMDEVHYFISDSTFGGATHDVLRNILHLSYSRFDNELLYRLCNAKEPTARPTPTVKRIYITATPDYVRDIIAYEEKCAKDIRKALLDTCPFNTSSPGDQAFFYNSRNMLYDHIEEFDFPAKKSKSNINPIFYFNQEYILQRIAKTGKKEKWLVFINDVKEGRALCQDIRKTLKLSSSFICADNASNDMCKSLEVNQRFDCRVLVATSVLDNGVSIIDDTLKNIVVDTTDKVQLIQMLGRKRLADGEQINLYVANKTAYDIRSYIQSNDEALRNIDASYGDVRTFENSLLSDEFAGRELFKYSPEFGKHIASDYTKYYIKRRGDEYVRLKSELNRDEDAFAKLVCSWLNIGFNKSMIANDMKFADIWADIEKILCDVIKNHLRSSGVKDSGFENISLKDYVINHHDEKVLSKEGLEEAVTKMLNAISLIKHGSGIRTEEGQPLKNANGILNFFASNGFDHYSFKGKAGKDPKQPAYTLTYINDGEDE